MRILPLLLIVILTACYKAPPIESFEKGKWEKALDNCSDYRIEKAKMLLSDHEEELLTKNQNEIKTLLGSPTRHRLFNRNQKFFYYQLDCDNQRELAIRFDALGRVKELTIELVGD